MIKRGLVLGKFMPLHQGHVGLIEFALKNCDQLTILVCTTDNEKINGEIRLQWVKKLAVDHINIQVIHLPYNEKILPNTSVSSRKTSMLWAKYIQENFPAFDVFFSSEKYGDYLAEFMQIEHQFFDQPRKYFPISASKILQQPFQFWEFIPKHVRPYFVKTVCIVGTESTGKSTLTQQLAQHFQTNFVPEMAREIIDKTNNVTYKHLQQIAALQAKTILLAKENANKILFCDTDLNITKSYCRYLFNRELTTEQWIESANQFNLYLFLEPDCPFVQDGTRLSETERNELNTFHKKQFFDNYISFISISGNWENRMKEACKKVTEYVLT